MLHSKKAILLSTLESFQKNKLFHKWLITLCVLLSVPVWADTVSEVNRPDNVISVYGYGQLVVPADTVELKISARTTENAAKDAEKKAIKWGLS